MRRSRWSALALVCLCDCSVTPRPCPDAACEPLPGRAVAVPGAQLWLVEHGAGPPVLLLHGIPTSSYLWRNVQRELAPTHRTLAVDLPGLGRSRLENPSRGSLEFQADAIAALLDERSIPKVVVVGHDVGGGVAQLLAARHPERVEALVLVDAVAFAEFWPVPSVRLLALPVVGEVASFLLPLRALVRRQLRRGMQSEPAAAVLDRILQPLDDPAGRWRFVQFVRRLDPASVEAALGVNAAAGVRTFLLWGAEDPFQPLEEARRLQAVFAPAPLRLVGGGGHFLPEERPREVAAFVREALHACGWE